MGEATESAMSVARILALVGVIGAIGVRCCSIRDAGSVVDHVCRRGCNRPERHHGNYQRHDEPAKPSHICKMGRELRYDKMIFFNQSQFT